MRTRLIHLFAAALCATTGCQSHLVFVTHSSVGLDVSGTAQLPNKVSLSFARYEAAIVPRKTDGQAHTVYGGMDADMTWFSGHAIKQTFATGEAAKLATGGEAGERTETTVQNEAPLIFLTATTYGLHLSAGEQSMPPNLLLGYRREEAAVIPVPDPAQEVRSIYADLHINTAGKTNPVTTNFSALGGVRIKQSFATGAAAESLASKNAEVQQNLQKAAGLSASAQLTKLRAEAKDLATEVAELLDALPENKLDRAGQAAVDAKLILNLDGFANLLPAAKIEKLKAASADRRSPRDVEKVKRFRDKLIALQLE